jgi:hypothetical protein
MTPDSRIETKAQQRAIAPFWGQLPFIFAFPFRPAPLIFLAFIVVASALVGFVLGPFALIFKGLLAYLGLRYGFNVLDLFRKGRFEGESPDHSMWGPELRPGKLGVVIAIYIGIAALLGGWAVQHRLANHAPTQQRVLDDYKREHAVELARAQAERAERQGELQTERLALARPRAEEEAAADEDERAWRARDRNEQRAEIESAIEALDKEEQATGEYGRPRTEILAAYQPRMGDPGWSRLLPWWFWLAMAALSFMLPATTLVIAIDDELFKSLNPTWVPHFLRAMGAAYLVLWAFFLLIVGSRQMVLAVGAQWPGWLRMPVEMGLAAYLALVLCGLLGYVIYQFHQELHLDVDVDFNTHRQAGGAVAIATAGSARRAVHAATPEMTPLERKVQALVAAGKVREAMAEVKDEMRYDRLDPDLNDQLHALHLRLGDREQTLAHGQQWLKALVRAERMKPAFTALQKLRSMDAGFTPHDPDCIMPLARRALEQDERAVAASLLNGFDKRFPEHKDLPVVYFLGARVLSEHRTEHGRAAALLRQLIERHPDHAVATEARGYLAVLEERLGPMP